MHLDDSNLAAYVEGRAVAGMQGPLRVEPAGEGNINYVRRVRAANGASLVVKHARPTLERFPEYSASPERLHFEHRYRSVVEDLAPDVVGTLPRVLDFDETLPALLMEDLEPAEHLQDLLLAGADLDAPLAALGHFLARVHVASAPKASALRERFDNRELRELHGEHIFTLPFEPNDFPVPQSVASAAAELLGPNERERIRELRERYYSRCDALVHADVQGTNVLVQGDRPRVIDAEIAHVGDPAFDLGVIRAHVEIHPILRAGRPGAPRPSALIEGYRSAGGDPEVVERSAAFCGVELLRRTLGAAQLSYVPDEGAAIAVVRHAVTLLR